jgi:hypothetical protein
MFEERLSGVELFRRRAISNHAVLTLMTVACCWSVCDAG